MVCDTYVLSPTKSQLINDHNFSYILHNGKLKLTGMEIFLCKWIFVIVINRYWTSVFICIVAKHWKRMLLANRERDVLDMFIPAIAAYHSVEKK